MKEINQNAFFDELVLMLLYKKETLNTTKIEQLLGGIYDFQNVNNIISNRDNQTSYIYKKYMLYDENENELTITNEGKEHIRNKFPPKPRTS
ncbi:hypothetical protein K4091_001705 [Campylobacter jejuni]|uniref:hypothetical protein n=1 Tax=Campylobacter jejuni TaxID=197 RepID=UPI00069B72CD|nr:hypothetical protein [Campylobacter jejuni]EAK1936000.1 hypothetical protein [Campylobacter jejuni]ECL3537267.1 hypothetical protein [Campylobacter jejuni]ECL3538199.1 hypothetical protein [Campylobacter jejuni]ECP5952246.1 hypothetical protein [Campylobacter jejuni]ECP5952806.1 hypothetical protein [Campylobacter jejuni]